jgi:hypothetical protein
MAPYNIAVKLPQAGHKIQPPVGRPPDFPCPARRPVEKTKTGNTAPQRPDYSVPIRGIHDYRLTPAVIVPILISGASTLHDLRAASFSGIVGQIGDVPRKCFPHGIVNRYVNRC